MPSTSQQEVINPIDVPKDTAANFLEHELSRRQGKSVLLLLFFLFVCSFKSTDGD